LGDRVWRDLADRSTDTAVNPAAPASQVDPTTVAPPVTADEEVTWWAGRMSDLDVLHNDTDPDGQPLTVCRVGPSSRDLGGFVYENGRLRVGTGERSRGTFTFTYYACNDHRLTPGMLTVHIHRARPAQVTSAPTRPGYFRISNPNGQRVRVQLSNYRTVRPDRVVRVPAHAVRYVAPRWRHERWYADIGPDGGYAGWGLVRLPQR